MNQSSLIVENNFSKSSSARSENRLCKIVGLVGNQSKGFETERRRDERAHSTEKLLFLFFLTRAAKVYQRIFFCARTDQAFEFTFADNYKLRPGKFLFEKNSVPDIEKHDNSL